MCVAVAKRCGRGAARAPGQTTYYLTRPNRTPKDDLPQLSISMRCHSWKDGQNHNHYVAPSRQNVSPCKPCLRPARPVILIIAICISLSATDAPAKPQARRTIILNNSIRSREKLFASRPIWHSAPQMNSAATGVTASRPLAQTRIRSRRRAVRSPTSRDCGRRFLHTASATRIV